MRSIFLLLSLFFFVFIYPAIAVASTPEPVRDIAQEKLRSGVQYYIVPVVRGRGGGLTLEGTNGSCLLGVVQERHEVLNGIPLTFTPVNPKQGVIHLSTDLNIKFSGTTICVQSTVWKLSRFDESTKQWFVTIGGVEGNPGLKTVDNWFKIEKFGVDYKLVFCPTVCKFCKVICRDVGVYIEDGVRRLALSDKPFKIMFKGVKNGAESADN